MKKPINIILGILLLIFLTNGILGVSHSDPMVSFTDTSKGEGQAFVIIAVIVGTILLVRISNTDWAKTSQGKSDWVNTGVTTPEAKKLNRRGAKR